MIYRFYRWMGVKLEKTEWGAPLVAHIRSAPKVYGNLEALLFALVLALLIRSFALQAFKIPSGSMEDTLYCPRYMETHTDHAINETRLTALGLMPSAPWSWWPWILPASRLVRWQTEVIDGEKYWVDGLLPPIPYDGPDPPFQRYQWKSVRWADRLFVNKIVYRYRKPRRGEIVVFKVPRTIKNYDPSKPIYIKRVVANEGETIEINAEGRLVVDGELVTEPDIFVINRYRPVVMDNGQLFRKYTVPQGRVLLFGDHTNASYDGRYWGAIPYENLLGKAFFRYWPPSRIGPIIGVPPPDQPGAEPVDVLVHRPHHVRISDQATMPVPPPRPAGL